MRRRHRLTIQADDLAQSTRDMLAFMLAKHGIRDGEPGDWVKNDGVAAWIKSNGILRTSNYGLLE